MKLFKEERDIFERLQLANGSEQSAPVSNDYDLTEIEGMLFGDSKSSPDTERAHPAKQAVHVLAPSTKLPRATFKPTEMDDKENNENTVLTVPPKPKSSIVITKVPKKAVRDEPKEVAPKKSQNGKEEATTTTTTIASSRPKRKLPSFKALDYNEDTPKAKRRAKASTAKKDTNSESDGARVREGCSLNLFAEEDDQDDEDVNKLDEQPKPTNTKRPTRKAKKCNLFTLLISTIGISA